MSTENKKQVVESLEVLVADTYALLTQTHLAHWNVEGPNFFQLHVAFEEQYNEMFAAVDEIAEHLRTYGAYAPGGFEMLNGLTRIGQMERSIPSMDFVAKLASFHEILLENAAKGRDLAGDNGFNETEDLFIERIRVHNKTLWMLKSHLA
jgi:starvation-inducible DNA-binding protein